ncbi:hypothetical protein RRS04_004921 [Klebsiella aerogenes]|nr:hypothetical protein [Klebsiella aerogenes]
MKTIFERFFNVANNDGKHGHQLVAFNYRQLLNKIDNPKQDWYYPEQYRRTVQNRSMRDHLYSLCVPPPRPASGTTPNKITAQKEPLFLLIVIDE